MSVVIEKGAIRSQIRGIENLPIIIALYEVIDDRKHSNSNKVFIDIDLHNFDWLPNTLVSAVFWSPLHDFLRPLPYNVDLIGKE